jgi:hypothetical protein
VPQRRERSGKSRDTPLVEHRADGVDELAGRDWLEHDGVDSGGLRTAAAMSGQDDDGQVDVAAAQLEQDLLGDAESNERRDAAVRDASPRDGGSARRDAAAVARPEECPPDLVLL